MTRCALQRHRWTTVQHECQREVVPLTGMVVGIGEIPWLAAEIVVSTITRKITTTNFSSSSSQYLFSPGSTSLSPKLHKPSTSPAYGLCGTIHFQWQHGNHVPYQLHTMALAEETILATGLTVVTVYVQQSPAVVAGIMCAESSDTAKKERKRATPSLLVPT